MLIGVDASRITRRFRTGTENYSLNVLRCLLDVDREDLFRLYFSEPPPPGLLPAGTRTQTRVLRLPRLWTHLALSRELLRSAPDVLFVPSHVLPLALPGPSAVVIYDVGHRFFP